MSTISLRLPERGPRIFPFPGGLGQSGAAPVRRGSRPAGPGDRASDAVPVFHAGAAREPGADVIIDLGLAGVRELPAQLLAEHRFAELEEGQCGPEAFGCQIVARRRRSSRPQVSGASRASRRSSASSRTRPAAKSVRSLVTEQPPSRQPGDDGADHEGAEGVLTAVGLASVAISDLLPDRPLDALGLTSDDPVIRLNY
jgi:hypothetical protein